jgi:hypothetical protein
MAALFLVCFDQNRHCNQKRKVIMSERDWNAEIIAEFRANQGEVKAPYDAA